MLFRSTYIPAIFLSASPTLSSFIQTTLEGLSPSLPTRLSAISDRYGPLVLPELIAAYRATEEFAVMVDRIMSKLGYTAPPTFPAATSKKDRRLSKRMSMSTKRHSTRSLSFGSGSGFAPGFLASDEPVRAWETAIFEPFLDWQVEYPELERKYLRAEMERETGGQDVMQYLVSGESERGARVLWEHSVAMFALAEDAVGRALAMTHGYAARGLVDVLDGQLVEFMEKRRGELVKARKGGVRPRPSSKHHEDDDEAALEGLEYSTEDWGSFQFGLRLLDTCRSITDKLAAFEGKLKTRLTTLAHTVKEARNDPLGYTIPGTTRGAVTMLRQSVLNSVELASLLDPLEKPFEHSLFAPPPSFPPSSPKPEWLPPSSLARPNSSSTTPSSHPSSRISQSTPPFPSGRLRPTNSLARKGRSTCPSRPSPFLPPRRSRASEKGSSTSLASSKSTRTTTPSPSPSRRSPLSTSTLSGLSTPLRLPYPSSLPQPLEAQRTASVPRNSFPPSPPPSAVDLPPLQPSSPLLPLPHLSQLSAQKPSSRPGSSPSPSPSSPTSPPSSFLPSRASHAMEPPNSSRTSGTSRT